MAVDDEARHRLHNRLDEVLGAEEAGVLMSLLPGDDSDRLAGQLRVQAAELKREMSELRAELKTEMSELRAEVRELGADLRAEIRVATATIRAETRTQARTLFLSLTGLQMTAAGLALGLSRVL